MPRNFAYNTNISKWGRFTAALLTRDSLVEICENAGLLKTEIEKVRDTEAAAEKADKAQRDANHQLKLLAPDIAKAKEIILEIFSELQPRLPNVANDLIEAGEKLQATAAQDLKFSERAIPRVPGAPEEEAELAGEELEAEAPEAPEEDVEEGEEAEGAAEEVVTDRQSHSQQAIANSALRLADYLSDPSKARIVERLLARKMSPSFLDDLKTQGKELTRLREERVLALTARKRATRAEHDAVKAHLEARGRIEPTITRLCTKNDDIDGLAVLHLGRKSAFQKK